MAKLIAALPMPPERSHRIQLGRRNIRGGNDEDLSPLTLKAIREEEVRKHRVLRRRALCDETFEVENVSDENIDTNRLVLDFDDATKRELISVDPKLVPKLKSHQRKGIKFLWDACYESVEETEAERKGGGAILAHCMGLGKTLQVVAFVHTLFRCQNTKVRTVLIISPVCTLLNWKAEFEKWLEDLDDWDDMNIYVLQSKTSKKNRSDILGRWIKDGGVMIMGYDMFRNMSTKTSGDEGERISKALQNPGPDLVVCDEGHKLKNDDSEISKALSKIRTPKRILLTGTPLQNNLIEYFCMVQFVRPNLLGTKKEFRARFVNPIENGRYIDSTRDDVILMNERTRLLHSTLDGFVQRLDHNVLKPFLPPKHEFVIYVSLSDIQATLYQSYIRNKMLETNYTQLNNNFFKDFQTLRLIWTHPMAMKLGQKVQKNKVTNDQAVGSSKDYTDSIVPRCSGGSKEEDVKSSDNDELDIDFDKINISTPADKDVKNEPSEVDELDNIDFDKLKISSSNDQNSSWWHKFVSEKDFENHENGPKLVLLFAVLSQCQQMGDKVLIFSQSIPSLDMIEYFLTKNGSDEYAGVWEKNLDYFRMDGQTPEEKRMECCNAFNRSDNKRARLFLISTTAGGVGINLTAANRVIVFDASWNPSNDIQSIFRVYRLGQRKSCYIYRFISQGTMEEKIYERQVTKQAVSCRVVDEKQINRYFTRKEIAELYTFNRKTPLDEVPELPSDSLLAELLKQHKNKIIKYHEHDSLLEIIEDVPENIEAENIDQRSTICDPERVGRPESSGFQLDQPSTSTIREVKKVSSLESAGRHLNQPGTSTVCMPEKVYRPESVEHQLKDSENNLRNTKHESVNVNEPEKVTNSTSDEKSKTISNQLLPSDTTGGEDRPNTILDQLLPPDVNIPNWKESVTEVVDRFEEAWILKAIRKLYPVHSARQDFYSKEILFQVRKKLLYEYMRMSKKKLNQASQLFATSGTNIPFEMAVDILKAVEETVPNYLRFREIDLEGSNEIEMQNKRMFLQQEVEKLIERETIKEKLRQLYPNEWRQRRFYVWGIVNRVRRQLINRYLYERKMANTLRVAYVFGTDGPSFVIEDHVLVDVIKVVVPAYLQQANHSGVRPIERGFNRNHNYFNYHPRTWQ